MSIPLECLFGSSRGWLSCHLSLTGLSDAPASRGLTLFWGVAHLMGFEVERRLEGQKSARLSSRPLVDGWLADLMSSQRVLLCGKADSKRMGMVVAKLIKWSFVHL
jgi:hypothetical protein